MYFHLTHWYIYFISLTGVFATSMISLLNVNLIQIFNSPSYLFSANFCTSTDGALNKNTATKHTSNKDNETIFDHSNNLNPSPLTHVDCQGNATMVDVSTKTTSHRRATASGKIILSPKAFQLVKDNQLSKKGSVLGVAQIAGIMAAKQTASLIPLCHNIPLSKVGLKFELDECECSVRVCSSVECVGVTGVEMEALTAVSVVLLTVYDMTKAVAKDHVISDIQLEEKDGGSTRSYRRK